MLARFPRLSASGRCTKCYGLISSLSVRQKANIASAAQALEEQDYDHEPAFPFSVEDAQNHLSNTAPGPNRPGGRPAIIQFPPPTLKDNYNGPKPKGVTRRSTSTAIALFDACVVTGNMPRARSLLDQIRQQADDATTLLAANRYLRSVVYQVIKKPTQVDLAWEFFNELQEVWNVKPDRTSFALLCKAVLCIPDQKVKEQNVKDIVHRWRSTYVDFGEVLAVDVVLTKTDSACLFKLSGLDYRLINVKYRDLLGDYHHPLEAVGSVNPTNQRGVGLKLVKHSLGVLTKPDLEVPINVADYNLGGDQLAFNLARQRVLEENAVDAAVLRWRHEHEDMKKRGGLAYKRSLNAMFWDWKERMLPLIQEEMLRIDDKADDKQYRKPKGYGLKNKETSAEAEQFVPLNETEADYQVLTSTLNSPEAYRARREYGPFLGLLSPEKMSAVAILELIRALTTETAEAPKTALLSIKIGRAIENEYHSEVLKKKVSQDLFRKSYKEAVLSKRLFSMSVRQARANAVKRQELQLFTPEWTQTTRARIGALMISFIMCAARITLSTTDTDGQRHTQEVPALCHSYQYTKGQKLGVIQCNEQLLMRLSSEPLKGSVQPRLLPMLSPPRPWYSWNTGGYLFTTTLAMRAKNCPEQIKYLKSASDRGLLDRVFTGLDVLGHTPWRVNDQVFKCALEAWNSGKPIGDIPPAETTPDLPDPPAFNADPAEKFAFIEKVRAASAIVKNFASIRSDINYKLEIARAFLNDTMYFPHSLDFRGRAYPIPPHFNHLGNDLCRGLLQFGVARKLGSSGLRWLKIHLANQCGHDKKSFQEREAFVDQIMEQVFEANDHPMDGTRWWSKTEKPWQCLATCFELAAAMRSPDPTEFQSYMPIHQDGTCNGLQHYAALGGDLAGAKQVNLEPSEKPQDVYQGVADIVDAEVNHDAAGGHELAKLLQGKIRRKLVKQTVMTNVYGVTWVGARLQIEGQLKDLELKKEHIFALASYLVNKVFQALRTMFTGAQEIQEWLRETASIITKSVHVDAILGNMKEPMTSVIWTSPLNLPIVQPYRKEVRRQIYTNLQTVFLSDPSDAAEVNSKKQSTAFPPNFIHSLDATHMLMSAVASKEKGICFAAVHDSYWTHAADTDTMNVILRNSFVELHSRDLMADLASEFSTRYADHYSPMAHIYQSGPAFKFAMQSEHLESGVVKSLPGSKSIVITDPEVAKKVMDLGSEHELSLKHATQKTARDKAKRIERGLSGPEDDERLQLDAQLVAAEESIQEKTQTKHRESTWTIWTPIAFPKLPKRGDFDVQKLRQSKYFFS